MRDTLRTIALALLGMWALGVVWLLVLYTVEDRIDPVAVGLVSGVLPIAFSVLGLMVALPPSQNGRQPPEQSNGHAPPPPDPSPVPPPPAGGTPPA